MNAVAERHPMTLRYRFPDKTKYHRRYEYADFIWFNENEIAELHSEVEENPSVINRQPFLDFVKIFENKLVRILDNHEIFLGEGNASMYKVEFLDPQADAEFLKVRPYRWLNVEFLRKPTGSKVLG